METVEPMAYDFSHDMSFMASRRMFPPHLEMTVPLYPNAAVAYAQPYPAASYGYSHPLASQANSYQVYSHGHPFHLQPPTLAPNPPPLQIHPQIQQAKNDLSPGNQSPRIKYEEGPPYPTSLIPSEIEYRGDGRHPDSAIEIDFGTEVDTLMKAIQSNSRPSRHEAHQLPPLQQFNRGHAAYEINCNENRAEYQAGLIGDREQFVAPGQKSRKKYGCTFTNCNKGFFQKTHLEIHLRSHTGDKPFVCLYRPNQTKLEC